ncbi:MAG: VCBS repeat-containing protein [Elusimicrobia bacterium]|nr:VCBS repeat-containing protein [Elusimicrobiota bacterium]
MPVKFRKKLIDNVKYEAASVFDVNNDGILDIVCGANWYEGPDWKKHKICDVKREGEYYNDFSDLPMDVNGDGFLDIVTGAWWGATLQWRENPKGKPVEWKTHDIYKCGSIETTRLFDIDKDGHQEIIPNTPEAPLAYYKLKLDSKGKGTGEFDRYVVFDQPSGHGLGFGDINGNGRPDIILRNGWLEAPEDPAKGKWKFHPEFDLGSASIPIIVHDVNNDGIADLIVGQAHNFGLHWWEQQKMSNGERKWIKHDIDLTASQYHDLQMADIDNDGELELVTGKRYRAHCGEDPGESDSDPVGIYYFKINSGKFEKNIIDFGKVPDATGCGIHFAIADLNGNGWLDVVAPGKDGLYLFENMGLEK